VGRTVCSGGGGVLGGKGGYLRNLGIASGLYCICSAFNFFVFPEFKFPPIINSFSDNSPQLQLFLLSIAFHRIPMFTLQKTKGYIVQELGAKFIQRNLE